MTTEIIEEIEEVQEPTSPCRSKRPEKNGNLHAVWESKYYMACRS